MVVIPWGLQRHTPFVFLTVALSCSQCSPPVFFYHKLHFELNTSWILLRITPCWCVNFGIFRIVILYLYFIWDSSYKRSIADNKQIISVQCRILTGGQGKKIPVQDKDCKALIPIPLPSSSIPARCHQHTTTRSWVHVPASPSPKPQPIERYGIWPGSGHQSIGPRSMTLYT